MKAALLVLFGFLAVVAMVCGAVQMMAAVMSDDGYAAREAGNVGGYFFLAGLIVLLVVIAIGWSTRS